MHYFTLQDVYARGYVRPLALSFVTCTREKIMRNYLDLQSEFARLTRLLKAGNWAVFRRDLLRRFRSIRYTERLLRRRLPQQMQARWWEHLVRPVELWSDVINGPCETGLEHKLEGLDVREIISELVDLELRLRRLYAHRKPATLTQLDPADLGALRPPPPPPPSTTGASPSQPEDVPRNAVQSFDDEEMAAFVRHEEAADAPDVPLDPPDTALSAPEAPPPPTQAQPPRTSEQRDAGAHDGGGGGGGGDTQRPHDDRGSAEPDDDAPEPPPTLLLPPSRYKCISFDVSLRFIDRLCGVQDVRTLDAHQPCHNL